MMSRKTIYNIVYTTSNSVMVFYCGVGGRKSRPVLDLLLYSSSFNHFILLSINTERIEYLVAYT